MLSCRAWPSKDPARKFANVVYDVMAKVTAFFSFIKEDPLDCTVETSYTADDPDRRSIYEEYLKSRKIVDYCPCRMSIC